MKQIKAKMRPPSHTCLFGMIYMALALLAMKVADGAPSDSQVNMPNRYTAMKGELVVGYRLNVNSTHYKSFNAMIHIEYLPGDAVLTNAATNTSSSSIHLARYILNKRC